MRLKTYFATGVDAAMTLARQELGPEAMLVHSKRTAGEAQALGTYEVVFGTTDAADLPNPEPMVNVPAAAADRGPESHSDAGLAALLHLMDQTFRVVRRSEAMLQSREPLEGESADLEAALDDAGMSADFRRRVQRETSLLPGTMHQRVTDWLEKQIRVVPQLGRTGFARRTVVLVGPPGSGKTTTLIKLAAQFGVAGRRPAQILSMDADRVGASEALRMNASVLGIGFQLLDSAHALSQALAEHAHKELILIDTPGYCAASGDEAAALAAYVASREDLDVHLVLPADLPLAGLQAHVERYSVFCPRKLLYTRVDEMQVAGPMVENAILSGSAFSFVASGQRIPEDLAPAGKPELLERLLPRWFSAGSGLQSQHAAA
jgi:flagellar biosynthesis protein FlhF